VGRRKQRRGGSGARTVSQADLLAYLKQQPGQAAGFRQILDDHGAGNVERRQIRDLLDQLVREGKVERHRGHRYRALPGAARHNGRIQFHRDGFAFVTPGDAVPGVSGDVFVPPRSTGTAMDGDLVSFALVSREKAEGAVLEVLERARSRVVGQLRFDGRGWFLSPADDRLPDRILVLGDVSEHKDKVVEVELTRFPAQLGDPAGEIVSVIGFLDEPEIETEIIMRKYGLVAGFSAEIEEEAAGIPAGIDEGELARRTDFRNRTTITIDPATARDFDDAVDVERLPQGGFRIGVHIADVAHFVRRGAGVDREARQRGCSVYFPDRVVPMLPEKLSNDICSLNAGIDRLAMSVVLELDAAGRVTDQEFHQSVIHSRERMNYEAVQRILDGDGPARKRYHRIVGEIETLAEAARLLLDQRIRRGTIDFDLPEPEMRYDEQGVFSGIARASRYFSHRLVEAFMIAANEAVARLLERRLPATIFRVHEAPDGDRVTELADTLAGLGLRFQPKEPGPKAFQEFLASIEGRPDARMISYLVLRSFRQAVYSTRNKGHFGLASSSYTHFTSPIRRYPDLVVHRLLKARLAGAASDYARSDLEAIAAESSARERIAAQAERDLFEWKRMLLLEDRLGDTLDAIVIHVFPRGMRIELVDDFIEGTIAVEDLDDDYYHYSARARALVGRRTRRRYQLGQRLLVRVARIDKLLGRAIFLPV
jgi:ribonuclease R